MREARVLFDSGCGVNFISRNMANKLGFKGPKVEVEFSLAGVHLMRLKTEKVKSYFSSAISDWSSVVLETVAYIIDKPSGDLNPVLIDPATMSQD